VKNSKVAELESIQNSFQK